MLSGSYGHTADIASQYALRPRLTLLYPPDHILHEYAKASFLKNFGNRLAWATLGLQAVIAAVQLAIQRHRPPEPRC